MWLEDQKVRSIYRRSAASSLKMKTVICTLWALALVCVVTEARPSASVSETRLDGSRAQNPLESSEPLEPRTSQSSVKSLAYYGGARGKFLIVHPSGRTYISNKPATKEEEDVGMEESGNGDDESVAINPPPDNASVAEAKPVGLALAGPGGVASSKPVATAVVGPGGLAIARPVATAIAGVKGTGPLVGLGPDGKLGHLQKQIFWNAGTNQLVTKEVSSDVYKLYPINLY